MANTRRHPEAFIAVSFDPGSPDEEFSSPVFRTAGFRRVEFALNWFHFGGSVRLVAQGIAYAIGLPLGPLGSSGYFGDNPLISSEGGGIIIVENPPTLISLYVKPNASCAADAVFSYRVTLSRY